jgi:formamidopyrimidine-DNA glycosylase
MDQKKSAGIGNYILAEVLYATRIHPFSLCGELSDDDWESIYIATIDILTRSYKAQSPLAVDVECFEFKVYGQRKDSLGNAVIREEGLHKRSVHWVREVQTKYAAGK